MTEWRRTIRSNPRAGLRVHELIGAAFVSEFLNPSPHLWVVSPWISDIAVLDNRDERLDPILGEAYVREIYLSEALALLISSGTQLHIAIRPDDHNRQFLERLERATTTAYAVHYGEDLHEKTLCGDDWLVTGSMNFTWRGLEINDEAVTYTVDSALAAQTRLDLEHRWSA